VALTDGTSIQFSESFLLGNSPRGKNGWWGEIKGLAVYNRTLLPDEIMTHSRKVLLKGMRGLVDSSGTAKSILKKPNSFIIPERLNALGRTMNYLPHKDMRFYGFNKADFMGNMVFFVPFGMLLTAIILKKYSTGFLTTFLFVTFAGGGLSCVIEGVQLLLPTRCSGMTDILSNILGSGFGMSATYIIRAVSRVNSVN